MVRNLVGTLQLLAKGNITCDDLVAILRARDRKQAGPTAPACGLFLQKVFYRTPPSAPTLIIPA